MRMRACGCAHLSTTRRIAFAAHHVEPAFWRRRRRRRRRAHVNKRSSIELVDDKCSVALAHADDDGAGAALVAHQRVGQHEVEIEHVLEDRRRAGLQRRRSGRVRVRARMCVPASTGAASAARPFATRTCACARASLRGAARPLRRTLARRAAAGSNLCADSRDCKARARARARASARARTRRVATLACSSARCGSARTARAARCRST